MPVEIFVLVFDYLAPEDLLCLQLTSKDLYIIVNGLRFDCRYRQAGLTSVPKLRRFVERHLKIENEMAKRITMRFLVCTACGKLKRRYDGHGSSEAHSKTGVLHRFCMSCAKRATSWWY